MKFRYVALSSVLALSLNVNAEEVTTDELCNNVADMAAATQEAHQNGAPLTGALRIVKESSDGNADIESVLRGIAIDAYSQSTYTTEEFQNKAIGQFRNKWHLICLKQLDSQ